MKFKLYLYLALTCIYAVGILYLSVTHDPAKYLAPMVSEYLRFIIPLKGSAFDFIYYLSIAICENLDKFGHFLFYFGLGLLLYLTLRSSSCVFLERYIYLAAIGIGLLYGAFIEVIQSFLPWRTASILDLIANGLGVAAMQLLIISLRAMKARLTNF